MEALEFGYISSDINHLTSIPFFVIMPLAILLAVCYWFRKKKKSIKEKEQSRWRLFPVGVILCFATLFFIRMIAFYGGMVFEEPKCRKDYSRINSFIMVVHHREDLTRHSAKFAAIFYDFLAYRKQDFPWCPEDREAVEKKYGVYIEKDDNQKDVKQ